MLKNHNRITEVQQNVLSQNQPNQNIPIHPSVPSLLQTRNQLLTLLRLSHQISLQHLKTPRMLLNFLPTLNNLIIIPNRHLQALNINKRQLIRADRLPILRILERVLERREIADIGVCEPVPGLHFAAGRFGHCRAEGFGFVGCVALNVLDNAVPNHEICA